MPYEKGKNNGTGKEFYKDFAEAYLTEGEQVGSCPLLNVGDTLVENGADA